MGTFYDTVIVGAGSAGCVLANRLSADPARRVLLVEAGPDYPDPASLPPDIADGTRVAPSHDWGLRAEPATGRGPGPALPRGRLVGGCSAVNACFALRGHPADYDAWAAAGNAGWSWADVLPGFVAVERDLDFGATPGHGRSGELPVRRYPDRELTPLHRAFLDTATAAGQPLLDDHNAPGAVGAGRLPTNCVDGRRVSCAVAFLGPARHRANLVLRPDTLVDRVEVRAGRAVAVVLAGGERVAADHVVLAAGAYATPAVLLRSGIGPAADLRALGVEPVADLPGVGYALTDHAAVSVDFPAPADWPLFPSFQSMLTLHSGTADPAGQPDLQVFASGAYADATTPTGRVAGVIAALVKPVSRGRLWLRDRGPASPPHIDLAHLREPADVDALADGLRCAADLTAAVTATPGTGPGRGDVRQWLRHNVWSYHHPVGTCAMGTNPEAGAVVDPAGRVHGVERLTVADASVMPSIPSANTNLPTVMLAHRLARGLTERQQRPPTPAAATSSR
jgi:choline dehydrogenase